MGLTAVTSGVVFVGLFLFGACDRSPAKSEPSVRNAGSAQDSLESKNLELVTKAEVDTRVANVFPDGLLVDKSSGIGELPKPPSNQGPDEGIDWVAELAFDPPISVDTLRAAKAAVKGQDRMRWVYVHDASGWKHLEKDTTGTYDRVAVSAFVFSGGEVQPADEIDETVAWAKKFFTVLDAKRPPRIPFSRQQLVASAKKHIAFHKRLLEEIDNIHVGVSILAPDGTKFGSRAIWEAAYAAGFFWGDGDYFYLIPTDEDVSQGIGMSGTTATGYFLPEWVAGNDPQGEAGALEMSFDVLRVYEPEVAYDVMLRAARYLAKRLGGALVGDRNEPFDEKVGRAELAKHVARLRAGGIEPGSRLAMRLF